jgi:DedD protein
MSPNRPYDDDGSYVERRSDPDRADREISLGTPTILGIFFALALVCACFFGFGYTMGRHSLTASQLPVAAAEPNPSVPLTAPKPAAGSLAAPLATAPSPVTVKTVPIAGAAAPLSSAHSPAAPADGMIVGDKPPAPIVRAPPQSLTPALAQPATSNLPPATSFVVQVAAVSSQDVADILLTNLQKKGYAVAVRHEPQDKLLHVQIGPFADRKDAEAMRIRVLADGFNAIVK